MSRAKFTMCKAKTNEHDQQPQLMILNKKPDLNSRLTPHLKRTTDVDSCGHAELSTALPKKPTSPFAAPRRAGPTFNTRHRDHDSAALRFCWMLSWRSKFAYWEFRAAPNPLQDLNLDHSVSRRSSTADEMVYKDDQESDEGRGIRLEYFASVEARYFLHPTRIECDI
ncbi:uncharacterized protein BT62DRAFT_1071024 [Guyanagaster necrorhizus]|uniref:Uncharacterized protein n=1 Tax=Guyanagaster necrorhizus TaxID=856835 RepID=A0A9P7W5T9_9AGAR|nr:uncharacterized protein BT62DRAFT_1071024 [Guyanagaster necrorhizus MCA 3950]KAG7451811.1 hypothetical protein BT62DRAFT_1071024 [Guyanagaster necrorhizus MCA 3950]